MQFLEKRLSFFIVMGNVLTVNILTNKAKFLFSFLVRKFPFTNKINSLYIFVLASFQND